MTSTRSATAVRALSGTATADRVLLGFALVFMAALVIIDSPRAHDGLLILLTAGGWIPLLGLRRWPLPAFLLVLGVESLHVIAVPLAEPVQFTSIPVATMVAAYTIATRTPWRQAWVCGIAAALWLLVIGLLARDADQLAISMFALDLVVGATGAGVLVRSRHERLIAMQRRAELAERTKDEEARRRVASERLRMARELHDVVAHNLALVNAQSSVAEYLVRSNPVAAEKALQNLTEHTRLALDELRSTVGLLRQADADVEGMSPGEDVDTLDDRRPVPGLAELDALLERHAAMPGDVSLTIHGTSRPVPSQTALAAYRIIQESLTNARKHAPGADVRLRVDWREDCLELRIVNDASPGEVRGSGPGTGLGLVGMRERATASGGSLEARGEPGGGWHVVAQLPVAPADTHAEEER